MEEIESVILFPSGVIGGMNDDLKHIEGLEQLRKSIEAACHKVPQFQFMDLRYKPIILFPQLEDYHTDKPPLPLRVGYETSLERAITVLNQAGVAHLDLRPENIMWKVNDDEKTIDMKSLILKRLFHLEMSFQLIL